MLAASLGALLIVLGGLVFLSQVNSWFDTGRWSEYPLADLINAPPVKSLVPRTFVTWLLRPQSMYGLHGAVNWLLESMPVSAFLAELGGVVLWVGLRW